MSIEVVALVGTSKYLSEQDLYRMEHVAKLLNALHVTGLSGGAKNSDSVWARLVPTTVQILPYDGFNNLRQSDNFKIVALENAPTEWREEAEEIARTHHPYGDTLRGFALQAHTRNVFQVLGLDLKSPVDMTIYVANETDAGKVSGGTATAVEISRSKGIPTFNLRKDSEYKALVALLEEAIDF